MSSVVWKSYPRGVRTRPGPRRPPQTTPFRKAADERSNRLTHAEFEREATWATWATRKYVPFVMQRISVAVQIAAVSEIRQALRSIDGAPDGERVGADAGCVEMWVAT